MPVRRLLLGLLLFLSLASAQTLVIFPLESQDVLLGVALAERLDEALAADATGLEVFGPDVAPALVPPITTRDGFINLVDFLDRGSDGDSALDSRPGAALVQETLGADAVLTGNLSFEEATLKAEFFLATPEQVVSFQVSAPEDDPGLLANKALAVLAGRLGLAVPTLDEEIDLSSSYGDYVRAVALVGLGLLDDAETVLADLDSEDLEVGEETAEDIESLASDIEAVRTGEPGSDAARMATLSLALSPLDEALSLNYFEELDVQTDLPVVKAWLATLYTSDNKLEEAEAAYAVAADSYAFGEVAQDSYLATRQDDLSRLDDLQASELVTAQLSASIIANIIGDTELEKAALQTLSRSLPSYVYPFERLSFIAFDEEDPMSAAQALAVAVRLEPESDLYWTNLGWSYYLLGLYEQSEEASVRAATLDPTQYIALYNLGLAQVVQGRLEDAVAVYEEAIEIDANVQGAEIQQGRRSAGDTGVQDAAIEDLENALEENPYEPAIHFALATLLEAEGRRDAAAEQFDLYLEASDEPVLADRAKARLEVLRAPLPPIEISPNAELGLGLELLDATPYHPGDRIYPSFELYTPGSELPSQVSVEVSLLAGDEVVSSASRSVDIPRNAIGYIVNSIGVDLPTDVAAGSYQLQVTAQASEDRVAKATLEVEVAGQPELVRQLVGRDIRMVDLASGSPLYSEADLSRSDDVLVAELVAELRNSASAAEEALPEVASGRFEGFSGGDLFRESSEEDVQDFLSYLLSQGTGDATFGFVDAYAQWALDGAPGAE